MYYIFHGDDELARTEQVRALIAKMGDAQYADLNTARFDAKVSLGEIRHACDAIPFLADKRLVLVEGLLAKLEPKRGKSDDDGEAIEEEAHPDLAQGLKENLPNLPAHARLVFIEAKTLAKNNPLVKFASADKNATIKEFAAPEMKSLPGWIQARVKKKGAEIEAAAINELAMHIGNDPRLLDNEIEKLITFRGNAPIRAEDVRALVASVGEANIFDLVDAVGKRQTKHALDLLHAHLAQNAAPQYLLSMIVRQFRMLLQLRDLAARNVPLDSAREQLHLHPFVAQKTWTQALNFTLPQLEAIYQRLLDTDLAMKTSRVDLTVALDLLIVELTR